MSAEPRKRVLVVEDDPDLADTFVELLEDRYDVHVASDGEQALQALGVDGFDAIVLDLMLPALSGEGVLEAMRERNYRVPVLISTARDDGGDVMRRWGAADWLRKPFPVSDLYDKLEKILADSDQPPSGGGVTRGSARTPPG